MTIRCFRSGLKLEGEGLASRRTHKPYHRIIRITIRHGNTRTHDDNVTRQMMLCACFDCISCALATDHAIMPHTNTRHKRLLSNSNAVHTRSTRTPYTHAVRTRSTPALRSRPIITHCEKGTQLRSRPSLIASHDRSNTSTGEAGGGEVETILVRPPMMPSFATIDPP